jgi:RND family efflux transporter MFP subunit
MRLLSGKIVVLLFGLYSAFALGQSNVPVTVKSFNELAVYPQISAPATVISLNDTNLSAQARAVIKDIPVGVGEVVDRGTVLILLDTKDYELAVRQAEAALRSIEAKLELAKYQLQRAETLSKQKAVSEELLHQRESELKTLQAQRDAQQIAIDMSKRELSKCIVRAPFKSIIKERLGGVGELANPGTPLIRIIDQQNIEVSAKVQAQDIPSLQNADNIELASLEKHYKLTVKTVTPALDPLERSQEVRLIFDATPALSGSAGTIKWRDPQPHLPPDMIVRRDKQLGVFVLQDQKAHFVPLPQAREGRPAQVSLSADARIIVDGRFVVRDGDNVTLQ